MRESVSHFRIVGPLGRGGMGEVFLAEDLHLNRRVAVKFITTQYAGNPRLRQRFLREAHAASNLNHPNIIVIHEVGECDDGTPFIAMEYVEGQTLSRAIDGQPLKLDRILDLGIEIADALDEARGHGIVHRDLKPANILINTRGHAKILDFGLAKLDGSRDALAEASTDLQSEPGAILGTVDYMSPEQALGNEVDHRSDIFSLGIILYQMATGRLPFEASTATAVLSRIINTDPDAVSTLNPEVPAELSRVIQKCLRKDPQLRYQTARDLLTDLQELKRASDSGHILRRASRPFPKRAALIALIALPVVVAAFWRAGALRPTTEPTSITSQAYPRTAIAVLPLQNLSADQSHAYFAGGLHDEILTQLARVSSLKVISRTSVMGYAGPAMPRLRQIASELGVGAIVQGSVQIIAGRLRVNVQLVDANSDEHLWTSRYDRTLDDAFAVQSDIASRIVSAVGATLTPNEREGIARPPTSNPEAYHLYLQGRAVQRLPGWSKSTLESAEELFQRAVTLDPEFAVAHAALAQVHGALYHLRHDPSPTRAGRVMESAQEALRLAPDLPQAHHAMGQALYYVGRDYDAALAELEIARAGLPNDADILVATGLVYRRSGNWEGALAMYEAAASLAPLDGRLHLDLGGLTYHVMHRYSDAVQAYDRARQIAPDIPIAEVLRAQSIFQWRGDLEPLRAAVAAVPGETPLGAWGTMASQRASLHYRERDAARLLQVLAEAPSPVFDGLPFYLPVSLYQGWAHQMLGNTRDARAAFESALAHLDQKLATDPADWRVHVARGHALAGLGRRREALQEARWIKQSQVYQNDAMSGSIAAEGRAGILAQSEEADAAIDEIERLLRQPSWVGVHSLRQDPMWDPIRSHPRFQALVAR